MSKRDLTDEELNDAYDQIGGGTRTELFDFQFQKSGPRKNWKNVVNKSTFNARLTQLRTPKPSDDIGDEITSALVRSIDQQIDTDPSIAPHHIIHFNMQAEGYRHAFQSTSFTVQEFSNGSERLDTYLQSLAEKLNSGEKFGKNENFQVEFTIIRRPGKGSGKKIRKPGRKAVETMLRNKRTIVKINNHDPLCCARAIVTMKAWCDRRDRMEGHRDYENLKRGLPIQEYKAKELHARANVPEGPCGISELEAFQKVLTPQYQIKVMAVDTPHMIIYHGPPAPRQILLVKVDAHFHGCTSFAGFLAKSYFCHECNRGYDHEDYAHHPCEGRKCTACHRLNCPDFKNTKDPTKCTACYRSFFGEDCYEYHLFRQAPGKKSICESFKKCPDCCKVIKTNDGKKRAPKKGAPQKHKCGIAECHNCRKFVDITTHQCYIQPLDPKEDLPKLRQGENIRKKAKRFLEANEEVTVEELAYKDPPLFIYADYEATQDEEGVHSPILICCEREDDEDTEVFYGSDCSAEFMAYLDDQATTEDGEERELIVVFHNLKGYDGMFILQQLYAEHRTVENQICVGAKVLSLQTGPIKFIDSLCFLPFSLASFPATFGLSELKKGFFPHLFNTSEHQEYVGTIPPRTTYDPEGMSKKKKAEFDAWYEEQVVNHVVFNLQEEMIAYCTSDVKLLKAGCQKFQAEFKVHGEFNPMEKCVTIASACNRYWRKKHLTPNTIAVEPPRGWHGSQNNQSMKALKWLKWCEFQLRRSTTPMTPQADRIAHAGNQGEHSIRTPARVLHVDGYDASCNTIYEFHGCVWHGCPRCFPNRNITSRVNPDRTVGELHEATQAKTSLLRALGYTVHEQWECDWDWEAATDPQIQEFLSLLELVEPLQPRDAFFGGRTGATTLHATIDESKGEQIRYVDVTSLYPYINKYGTYPVGHPHIITNPEGNDISNYYGMVKVDVLPPYELFNPVLPYRSGGKLTFPLCRTCVHQEQAKPMLNRSHICNHTPQERVIRGTWCTPELERAVDMGYQIVRIHEVWHFPEEQRVTGLFADYVNTWLKIKQESSGWPGWMNNEDDKTRYVQEYEQREGIKLDPEQIVKNPGRKATAKVMLNSFWGKFGERMNKPKTEQVTTPARLFSIVSDPLLNITTIRICTEDILEVVYTFVADDAPTGNKTNTFIAAFTTAQARLKLYESLQKLDKQVLYYDTDSVIYRWRPDLPSIALGDFLGEMTDELDGGDYIVEFVSGGAKNYGYVTKNGKVCCKVRGFTLNIRGSKQLNYQIMKQNVLDEISRPFEDQRRNIDVINPFHFTRNAATKRLKTVQRIKRSGLVFDKRVVDKNTFTSYPYGYALLQEEDINNVEMLIHL